MSNINLGNDAAFPAITEHTYAVGLTKREYLVAQAMQGIISSCYSCAGWTGKDVSAMAHASVLLADAVLSEIKNSNQ